jgi:parvulin-like peptidyl-prolyl isomerase
LWIAAVYGLAVIGGIVTAQPIIDSDFWRTQLGVLFGRGRLVTLVNGCGIYEGDIDGRAEMAQERGTVAEAGAASDSRSAFLQSLIAECALNARAAKEPIESTAISREFNLIQAQILPDKAWRAALARNCLSNAILQRVIDQNSRDEHWLERNIAEQIGVQLAECQQFYEANFSLFRQPIRFRVRHTFAAAPPGTPDEIVQQKRAAMEDAQQRLNLGAPFSEVTAAVSEDEATKLRGGDLDFFAEARMPPDFFASVKNMTTGQHSRVVRTRLGFHVLQLIDVCPATQLSFEQARPEIVHALQNRRRTIAVAALKEKLSRMPSINGRVRNFLKFGIAQKAICPQAERASIAQGERLYAGTCPVEHEKILD